MMKQRIFIVEPYVDSKLGKFSPNFDVFTPPPAEESRVDVREQIRRMIGISVRPSQMSGLFIFSLDKGEDRKFNFSSFSIPMLLSITRVLNIIGIGYYSACADEYVNIRFGVEHGDDSTLGVTERILSGTIFVSDTVGAILFFAGRKSIMDFWNKLEETLILFADELQDQSWIRPFFCQISKKSRWLVNIIFASAVITTVMMIKPDVIKVLGYIQGDAEFDWDTVAFIAFAVSWFTVLFNRLFLRIVLMSNIDLLRFGFETVKEHAKMFEKDTRKGIGIGDVRIKRLGGGGRTSVSSGDKSIMDISVTDYWREVKLNKILEKYRTMEELLAEFNQLFASHLLIGIVSLVVVVLMALFHFFVEINYTIKLSASIFGLEAVVNILVLFALGTAATDMASEADACVTALRDVPLASISPGLKQKIMLHFQHAMAVPLAVSPGYFFSLNRKMLTSVAGTLTTYLIVLIQFQTGEKHLPKHNVTTEGPSFE